MIALFFTLYLICCLLVGYLARDRMTGFIGFSVLSFVFTPVVMFVVYALGMPRDSAS